jgi:hypothetical protein
MKTYYLHLRAFSCDLCQGPVVTGSTAVRERDIEKETEITQVGAICLSCGHRQSEATAPGRTRDFPPVLWEPPKAASWETRRALIVRCSIVKNYIEQ